MKKKLWLLLIVLSVTLVSGYKYSITNQPPPIKLYQNNFICIDTDIPAYNPFMRGEAIIKSSWNFFLNNRFPDKCKSLFLLEETYCGINKVEKVILNCKLFGNFACYSGECIPTNLIPGWDAVPHYKFTSIS
jgi:hypothetical protein